MPPQVNFSCEDIVNEGFNIVRKEGLQGLSARSVARNLKSSTQPIYRAFDSMQQLEQVVLEKIKEYAAEYMLQGEETEKPFLSIGLRYVQFAREEKELFKLLYLSESAKGALFDSNIGPFHKLLDRMKADQHLQGLDETRLQRILQNMTIFTHGLTTLLWSNSLQYSKDSIRTILEQMGRTVIEWEWYQQLKTEEQAGRECEDIFSACEKP